MPGSSQHLGEAAPPGAAPVTGSRTQGRIFISCGVCYIMRCFEEEKCFMEMSVCCFPLQTFPPKIHMLCKPLATCYISEDSQLFPPHLPHSPIPAPPSSPLCAYHATKMPLLSSRPGRACWKGQEAAGTLVE